MPIIEMLSKYTGKCAACKQTVNVGDSILYNSDVQKNKVKHVECRVENKPAKQESLAYKLHPETMIQVTPVFKEMHKVSSAIGFDFSKWTAEQMQAYWEYCLKYLNAKDEPEF